MVPPFESSSNNQHKAELEYEQTIEKEGNTYFSKINTAKELADVAYSDYDCFTAVSYDDAIDQVLLVALPGLTEPPTSLRRVIDSSRFEIDDEQVTGRNRWIALVSSAENTTL